MRAYRFGALLRFLHTTRASALGGREAFDGVLSERTRRSIVVLRRPHPPRQFPRRAHVVRQAEQNRARKIPRRERPLPQSAYACSQALQSTSFSSAAKVRTGASGGANSSRHRVKSTRCPRGASGVAKRMLCVSMEVAGLSQPLETRIS